MSGTSGKEEYGGGRLKMFLSVSMVVIIAFANLANSISALSASILKFSDTGHALAATMVFSFFIVYVMMDMIRWRDDRKVFLAGLAVIAISAYWWIGFMAKYNVPHEPILPASLYPPNWAYLLMAAGLAGWAYWDIQESMSGEFEDNRTVFTGGAVLMGGIGLGLFMTLRIPVSN